MVIDYEYQLLRYQEWNILNVLNNLGMAFKPSSHLLHSLSYIDHTQLEGKLQIRSGSKR